MFKNLLNLAVSVTLTVIIFLPNIKKAYCFCAETKHGVERILENHFEKNDASEMASNYYQHQ